jgi:spore coat polysaccharide biosynthesis predicted glycosyltransferase SpsG
MSIYPVYSPRTQFLLGTTFALLRKEFLMFSRFVRQTPQTARRILVTFGGSDPGNCTATVIRALAAMPTCDFEVTVVIGGLNAHSDEIDDLVRNDPRFIMRRNAKDMPELMAWADLAVTSGGSTCWEMAFMGLPMCIITIADNQYAVATMLHAQGVAENFGWYEEIHPESFRERLAALINDSSRRDDMSRRGRLLVDGSGPLRVIQAMNSSLGG